MRRPTPHAVCVAAAAALPAEMLALVASHHVAAHAEHVARFALYEAAAKAPLLLLRRPPGTYRLVKVTRSCGAQESSAWLTLAPTPGGWNVVNAWDMSSLLTSAKVSRPARFHLTVIEASPPGPDAPAPRLVGVRTAVRGGKGEDVAGWVHEAAKVACSTAAATATATAAATATA